MKVVVIGGTGHVGTYLVPRLVEAGYSVTVVTRGTRSPYSSHGAWQSVKMVEIDRDAEEKDGKFGKRVIELQPDVVIDMICFTEASARQLVEALRGQVQAFIHCGTVWIHGRPVEVPVREEQPRQPIDEYGTQKAAIEAYLLGEARCSGFPVTCIHPGHIVGPGWVPLNPQANFNPMVFTLLGRGEEVILPNHGSELLHHVHADDVAQVFVKVLENWNVATGEGFHVVSPQALTLRGYAAALASWFGKPAKLKFLPWEEFRRPLSLEDAESSRGHLEHSPNCFSIAKAQRLLDYQPRYTSLQAITESVGWLIARGVVKI